MKLAVSSLVSLALAGPCLAQTVQVRVLESAKETGSGVFTRVKLPGGGLRNTVTLTLKQGQMSIKIVQERTYDRKGAPLTENWTISQDGKVMSTIKGTFDAKGIALKMQSGGPAQSTRVEATGVPSRTNPAVLWFWSVKPAPGTTIKYGMLDLQGGRFKTETIRYVGPKTATIGGKTYQGHELKFSDATYLLDAEGMPLRVTQGKTVFERR